MDWPWESNGSTRMVGFEMGVTMKKIVFAALALSAAVPAYAQDIQPGLFTGPRFEARVGLDRPVVTVDVDGDEESEGKSGVTYGGELGFDFDLNSLVVGAYAGIEGSTVKTCSEVLGGDEACLSAGRNITVGGRLGTRIGTRALGYVKGGYSNGQLKLAYEDFENIIDDVSTREELDGFHLGAGIEAMIGGNAYGKIEYVYTNHGSGSYEEDDIALGAELERHQVVAGVGVRF